VSTETKAAEPLMSDVPRSLLALRILWNGRKVIAAASIICAVVAAAVSLVLPETFESSVSLLLFPPPYKEANDMSSLMPKVLSVPDYEILLTSDGVLMQAAEKAKTIGKWAPEDLKHLSEIKQLRNQMSASVEVNEKTVTGVRYSPVITLKARASTPEHARDLAKAWAEVTEELTASLYQKGKTGLKDFVNGRFDVSRDDLMGVHQKLLDIELEWNDELEHARLFNKHERLLTYEEKLTDLQIQIATATKEVQDLKTNLAQETEYKTLWKSPPMTAVFLEQNSAAKNKEKPGKESEGYQEEVLNEVYTYLKEKIIVKDSELANMKEYEQQMMSAMEELGQEVQSLREESARRSFERKTLELQIGPLKSSYDLLAAKLEQAKIAEAEQENVTDIKVVAEPIVPDEKILPMRSVIVGIAAFLGFTASTLLVYFRAIIKMIE